MVKLRKDPLYMLNLADDNSSLFLSMQRIYDIRGKRSVYFTHMNPKKVSKDKREPKGCQFNLWTLMEIQKYFRTFT